MVLAAARQHPDVLAIRVGEHPAGHTNLLPLGHLHPVVLGVIGIVGDVLGGQSGGEQRGDSAKQPGSKSAAFD